jgi:hypothetical protein
MGGGLKMKKSELLFLAAIITITILTVTLITLGYMVVAGLLFIPTSGAGITLVIIVADAGGSHGVRTSD